MRTEVKGELKLKVLRNGQWCELLEQLCVHIGSYQFFICEGFQTDFASVPKLFWSIIPPMGLHTVAAVVHDYLYRIKIPDINRKRADNMFYDLMRYYGVPRVRAFVMWVAVRLFGWIAWNRK